MIRRELERFCEYKTPSNEGHCVEILREVYEDPR